jgi:hypothetical protein
MPTEKKTMEMAAVHRPGDEVLELPAGKGADELRSTELHVVEMPEPGAQMATVHRPGDEVVSLPPGKTVGQLTPGDYQVVDLDP